MMQTCPRVSSCQITGNLEEEEVHLRHRLRSESFKKETKSCRVYLLGPAAAGATAPCGGGLLLEL